MAIKDWIRSNEGYYKFKWSNPAKNLIVTIDHSSRLSWIVKLQKQNTFLEDTLIENEFSYNLPWKELFKGNNKPQNVALAKAKNFAMGIMRKY